MIIDACCTIGSASDAEPKTDELIKLMDECKVDQAVLHAPDRCYAWDNEQGNEMLLRASEEYSGRLIATATANPWRSDAWAVLKKAIDAGAGMLSFSPSVQGFVLSEGKLDAILKKLTKLHPSVPVFIHTGHHSNSTPAQLLMVANRFKQLNFVMGHCGSTDYKADAMSVCSACKNIYPETSFARPQSFLQSTNAFDLNRVIAGSGFPHNNYQQEWRIIREFTPDEHAKAVFGGTAASLLGIGGAK